MGRDSIKGLPDIAGGVGGSGSEPRGVPRFGWKKLGQNFGRRLWEGRFILGLKRGRI